MTSLVRRVLERNACRYTTARPSRQGPDLKPSPSAFSRDGSRQGSRNTAVSPSFPEPHGERRAAAQKSGGYFVSVPRGEEGKKDK